MPDTPKQTARFKELIRVADSMAQSKLPVLLDELPAGTIVMRRRDPQGLFWTVAGPETVAVATELPKALEEFLSKLQK